MRAVLELFPLLVLAAADSEQASHLSRFDQLVATPRKEEHWEVFR